MKCMACDGSGLSTQAMLFQDEWYGNVPFSPRSTGSSPFTQDHPIVRKRAENAIARSPEYFGIGETAIALEARRLSHLFNVAHSHHLSTDDIAALIAADRLWDFTRTPRTAEQQEIVRQKLASGENAWLRTNNGYIPTPAEVNLWSISGFGHDSINCHVVIKAKCNRLAVPYWCARCKGEGTLIQTA